MQTDNAIKVGPVLDDRAVFHVLTSIALRAGSLILRSTLALLDLGAARRRR